MSIAFVQANHGQGFSSTGTATATLSSVGAGNTIVGIAVCDDNGTGTWTGVADGTNTYTALGGLTGTSASTRRNILFVAGNVAAGSYTITASMNASIGNWIMVVAEFSGTLASANPVDNSGAAFVNTSVATPGAGTTDGITTGNFTTVTNGCMLVGLTSHGINSSVATAGTGFIHQAGGDATIFGGIMENLPQSSASASSKATFTSSTNDTSFVAGVALAPGAATIPTFNKWSEGTFNIDIVSY